MFASPVFKNMFSSLFKEAASCLVELPGKNINAVLDMLDFIYPSKDLKINGMIHNHSSTPLSTFKNIN